MFALTALQAQTKPSTSKPTIVNNQCDGLKKENENLKKSLGLNQSIKTVTTNDIEFVVKKVVGDIKTQMITFEIVAINKTENRDIFLGQSYEKTTKIVTVDGTVLFPNQVNSPSKPMGFGGLLLNTDIPIKFSMQFGPLLPSNEYIKLLDVHFKYDDREHHTIMANAEFKDLKIEWK
jgi:hypothetical protein